jgi:hypothetical protein
MNENDDVPSEPADPSPTCTTSEAKRRKACADTALFHLLLARDALVGLSADVTDLDSLIEDQPLLRRRCTMTDDIRFWTTLIKVTREPLAEQRRALGANCTHVAGPYWIMEGETDYLRDEGIRFREVAEGEVGALGDLSEGELRQVCLDSYGVELP